MASISDLTPRELEILQFVIAGKTNKAIAGELYVSAKTVEFHLENIYTKIGVRTRLMTVVWAIQNGMEIETREIPS
jgi:DNA-binding NarL/FixJ family response regulator